MHTGFFANQGAVATVDSDDGGERSSGGAGDAGGADSEVIVRPKKKKVQNANTYAFIYHENGEETLRIIFYNLFCRVS